MTKPAKSSINEVKRDPRPKTELTFWYERGANGGLKLKRRYEPINRGEI